MKYVRNHLGSVIVTVVAVIAGIFIGLLLFMSDDMAEAVIGGIGNLGDSSISVEHKHNLSAGARTTGIRASSEERICVFCHTPHGANIDSSLINAPLWNHTLSSASYDLSNLSTFLVNTAPSGDNITIDGASKLCMSCHDGTVAVGATGSVGNITMVGSCLDGDESMSDACSGYLGTTPGHHIFSVPMNDILISDSLANCVAGLTSTRLKYPWIATATAPYNDNVLLRQTTNTYKSTYGVERSGGKYKSGYNYGVQCSTCHDPHLYREVGGVNCNYLVDGCTDYTDPICLACHTTDCP